MTLSSVVLIFSTYWFFLFISSSVVERYKPFKRFALSPLCHVLALGLYTGSWSYTIVFDMVEHQENDHIAYYLGPSLAFLMAPLIIYPIYKACKIQQLGSLADLFAFRFRSRSLGTITTLTLTLACFLVMVLHTQSLMAMTVFFVPSAKDIELDVWFFLAMAILSSIFGAKYLSNKDQHAGLLFTLGIETVFKLTILIIMMIGALYYVFDGSESLDHWIASNSSSSSSSSSSSTQWYQNNSPYIDWNLQLILFFSSIITMPHMFHLTFNECYKLQNYRTSSWALPLLLLLFAVTVLPIYWAAKAIGYQDQASFSALILSDYFNLPWWPNLVYFSGLTASTGLLIVCTIALSDMLIKHVFLPITYSRPHKHFLSNTVILRKITIMLIFVVVSIIYTLLDNRLNYKELSLNAYLAAGQCIPGLLGLLFWPKAKRQGVILGILLGLVSWFFGIFLPCIQNTDTFGFLGYTVPKERWHHIATITLSINLFGLIIGSLLSRSSHNEQQAAAVCFNQFDTDASKNTFEVNSVNDIVLRLSKAVGIEVAEREVKEALIDLNLSSPLKIQDFRKLRRQVEANLSGIFGPSLAQRISNEYFPWQNPSSQASKLVYIEEEVEHYQTQLTGIAKELDNARRFHRRILEDLPVGVCLLSKTNHILLWNIELERISDFKRTLVEGRSLDGFKTPIFQLLNRLKCSSKSKWLFEPLINSIDNSEKQKLWLDIEKKALPALNETLTVFLIEDVTLQKKLEDSLQHKERLMSLGQLAAGVAHEIGNPITGIACMAQNLTYETADEIVQTSKDILEQTQKVTNIVQSLVRFAHSGISHEKSTKMKILDLNDCIENSIKLIELNHKAKFLEIKNRVPQNTQIKGFAFQIEQVFLNLLSNACDASTPNQTIIIEIGNCTDTVLEILVIDQGSGISDQHKKRLFEPFFTTKDVGQGTGLGLPLAYSIMREHNGSVDFLSPYPLSGKGTCVCLYFPKYQSSPTVKLEHKKVTTLATGE